MQLVPLFIIAQTRLRLVERPVDELAPEFVVSFIAVVGVSFALLSVASVLVGDAVFGDVDDFDSAALAFNFATLAGGDVSSVLIEADSSEMKVV